jgi:hypothetical protein
LIDLGSQNGKWKTLFTRQIAVPFRFDQRDLGFRARAELMRSQRGGSVA